MPLYDLQCERGHIIKDVLIKLDELDTKQLRCPKCYGILKREFPMTRFPMFKSFICHDLGPEPIKITSWKQLEGECKKRGVEYEVGPTKYTRRERPRSQLKKKVERNAVSSYNA